MTSLAHWNVNLLCIIMCGNQCLYCHIFLLCLGDCGGTDQGRLSIILSPWVTRVGRTPMLTHFENAEGGGSFFFFLVNKLRFHGCLLLQHKLVYPNQYRFPGGFSWLRWQRNCLQCRRPGFNSWGGKISWRRKWQPVPVFLLGEFHGHRSLAGYYPWGHKELDMIEWITLTNQPIYEVFFTNSLMESLRLKPCDLLWDLNSNPFKFGISTSSHSMVHLSFFSCDMWTVTKVKTESGDEVGRGKIILQRHNQLYQKIQHKQMLGLESCMKS